jgi:hypothetical protein
VQKIWHLYRSLYYNALMRLYKNHCPPSPAPAIRTTQTLRRIKHLIYLHIIHYNHKSLPKSNSKMKQSIVFSVLAMALAASALPTNGGGTTSAGQCGGETDTQVCCGGGLLSDILGTVQALGSPCGGTKKCCSTNAATVSIPPMLGRTL